MQIRLHHLDSVVKPRNDKGAGSEKKRLWQRCKPAGDTRARISVIASKRSNAQQSSVFYVARSAFLCITCGLALRRRYICAAQHYQLDCFVTLAMTEILEHTKFPSIGGVSARTGWSRECVIIKLPKDHLPAARYSSTGGELATFQHVCRLRTASLPHPALRLDSLRA